MCKLRFCCDCGIVTEDAVGDKGVLALGKLHGNLCTVGGYDMVDRDRANMLCVTNRHLVEGEFLARVEAVARMAPAGIILREKDLSEEKYYCLAQQVMEICGRYEVPCILHSFVNVAIGLEAEGLHVPLPVLRGMTMEEKAHFRCLGASCHSVEEAKEAEELGCSYVVVGHVFATDCKKGIEPRGLHFLQQVCQSVDIPVYAIGGIDWGNYDSLVAAGAKGGCMMSGWMKGDITQ
jgi:thiamine-phosphate pyrophosphorylase